MTDNSITPIAARDGRDYITPEDVADALLIGVPLWRVRRDTLEVLGGLTDFGAEDHRACAAVAFGGIRGVKERDRIAVSLPPIGLNPEPAR